MPYVAEVKVQPLRALRGYSASAGLLFPESQKQWREGR